MMSITPGCALRRPRQLLAVPTSQAIRPSRRGAVSVNALALPAAYGYVIASVAVTGALSQYLAIQVAVARKECGLEYPAMYATKTDVASKKFNCTQRAHQNTLEYMPAFLAMEMLLGLQYPIPAAALGMLWNLGRLVYAQGYSTGDPKGRLPGTAISGLVYVALVLGTLATGVQVALL